MVEAHTANAKEAGGESATLGLTCNNNVKPFLRTALRDARFSDWHFSEREVLRRPPRASLGRLRLPYQYVLPAYLAVFIVGILLGLALSPATPEELEWLAARAERLQGGHYMPGRAAARSAHLGASQLRGGQPHNAGRTAPEEDSTHLGVSRSPGVGQPNGAGTSAAEVQAGGLDSASNSSMWSVEVQPGSELRHLKEALNEASDVAGLDSARGHEDIR